MAIFHELDLVKFSELFSVNFDELRHQNRAIDSARGSFLGKELPTGLRLAEGSAAKPPDLKSIFENPVIVIYLGDFSTHRSCSDFKDRFFQHASTARNDVMRVESDGDRWNLTVLRRSRLDLNSQLSNLFLKPRHSHLSGRFLDSS